MSRDGVTRVVSVLLCPVEVSDVMRDLLSVLEVTEHRINLIQKMISNEQNSVPFNQQL